MVRVLSGHRRMSMPFQVRQKLRQRLANQVFTQMAKELNASGINQPDLEIYHQPESVSIYDSTAQNTGARTVRQISILPDLTRSNRCDRKSLIPVVILGSLSKEVTLRTKKKKKNNKKRCAEQIVMSCGVVVATGAARAALRDREQRHCHPFTKEAKQHRHLRVPAPL